MGLKRFWLRWPKSGLMVVTPLGMMLALVPVLAQPTGEVGAPEQLADRIIIYPPIIWPYPQPRPVEETVRVEFDAQGTEWGAVYLDGRLIYRPHNFDRRATLRLRPGGYRLEITGVVRSDRWASGFLDIGRDNSQIVVVRFSKTGGVRVSGDPNVWIPD